MDFRSLSRKELQALCKKNKIPANITNIAMADSLAALQHVEGLEEFLNQPQRDPQQCPEDIIVIGSPDAPRTSCRTSTRSRKPVIKEDPESSQPLTRTRRGTRREVMEDVAVEQDSSEVPPKTPAAPNSRRRAPLVSVTKNTETHKDEISSVQRAYSTRRSVRLLEQTLEKLNLGEEVNIQTVKIDGFSKGELINGSERTDEKEVSLEKKEDLKSDNEFPEWELVNDSKRTDENEVSLDKKEDLKSDDSPEIQREFNNNLEEEIKDDAHGEEDMKSAPELEDLVETSNEKMEVKDGTLVEEDEVENSLSKEFKTDDPIAVAVSDEVQETVETVLTQNLEGQSESGIKESGICVNVTSEEESPMTETLTQLSMAEDSIVPANNGSGLNMTEPEASLFDVNVVETEVLNLQPKSMAEEETDEYSSEEEEDLDASLIDVKIVQAEDNKALHHPVSGTKIQAETPLPPSSPPFAADQLSGQFPRPSLPSPSKSASKSRLIIQMIDNAFNENAEKSEVENEENDNDDENRGSNSFEDLSLRQLHKMLKIKLQIKNDKKAEKARTALQALPENRIAVDELP